LHAIHEAYRNILPPNVFPATLLFLEMPYDEVDVNVHPAKIEVRFRRSQFVHDFTRDAIRQALMNTRPIASFAAAATMAPNPVAPPGSFARGFAEANANSGCPADPTGTQKARRARLFRRWRNWGLGPVWDRTTPRAGIRFDCGAAATGAAAISV